MAEPFVHGLSASDAEELLRQTTPPTGRARELIERPLRWISPRRVLPLMVVSIFTGEFLVMLLLANVPGLPMIWEALIDSTVLLVLLAPTFYFFHYRPLKEHYIDRKEIIDQMLESEERLNLALAAVNDGIWDWDLRSGKIFVNPRGSALFGYQPGEIEARAEAWEKLIHPEDREATLKAVTAHLEGRVPRYETEHRLRSKTGDWIWVLSRGRVVEFAADGQPLRMIGTNSDISDRKRAEEALRASKDNIRRLSRQLMQTSEMEKKVIAQDLHDGFGQVLTAIQLGLEMIEAHEYEGDEALQFHCRRLLDISTRLQRDVRRFSDRLRPRILDDLGLVPALEDLLRDLANLRPKIEVNFSAEAGGVRLDDHSELVLYRICQEALNNAVKHAEAGQIEVRLAVGPGEICLAVTDDGRGLATKQAINDREGNWGMGLLGMNERAAAVGGTVDIVSHPGEGTSVRVRLPFSQEEE